MAARSHVNLGHRGGAGFARNERAPGDLAGEEGCFLAIERGPDAGMKAVGADQKRGVEPIAAFQDNGGSDGIKVDPGHARQQAKGDTSLDRPGEEE